MSEEKESLYKRFYDDYEAVLDENRYGYQKLSQAHFEALFSIFEDMTAFRKKKHGMSLKTQVSIPEYNHLLDEVFGPSKPASTQ